MNGLTTSSQSSTSNQNTAPWSVQQPYLQQAFGQAQTNLADANGKAYNGEQIAQFTPDQLSTFQKMIGYGGNSAGADTSTNVGMSTATSGANALSTALAGMKGFSPTGGTDSNIAAATAYANNPATDGMIDAAMRDSRRSVSEQALPQIARDSANSGNAMSSRRAISEGIVERGLADKTADVSAGIRGDQFSKGLALAEGGRQYDNSAILDALKASASAGGSAVGTGVGAIGSGIQQQGGLFDIANAGGAGGQAATQAGIDNEKAKTEYGTNTAAMNLQNFMKIIGGQNWGGTSSGTATQESTPSMWSTIGSALGMGSSLMRLSDRRMKRDIELIGHAPNGLPVYTFRYLGDDEVHTGLMAQDVEKVKPEAVVEFGGIKHVNYDLALA